MYRFINKKCCGIIGLTMVGKHQSTGKSLISPAQVACVLDDGITKKYLQSIRRILIFFQIRYNISMNYFSLF